MVFFNRIQAEKNPPEIASELVRNLPLLNKLLEHPLATGVELSELDTTRHRGPLARNPRYIQPVSSRKDESLVEVSNQTNIDYANSSTILTETDVDNQGTIPSASTVTTVHIPHAFTGIRKYRFCVLLYTIYVSVIILSLVLGLWWSIWKKDVGAGFTLAAYVAGVGTALLMPLQQRHNRTCEC